MAHQPSQQNHIPDQRESTRSNEPMHATDGDIGADFVREPLSEPLPMTGRERGRSPVLQPRVRLAPVPGGTALATQKRSTPSQQCPSCGATQPTSTSVCMSCGTFLPAKSERIRCRRCGTQASANLHLCPGCGRELQAAVPRSLSWLVPIILLLLFVIVMQQFLRLNALNWSQIQVATGWQWLTEIGERLDPQITIKTIPVEVSTVAAEPLVENLAEVNALARLVTEPLSTVNHDSSAGKLDVAVEQNAEEETTLISSTVTVTDAMVAGATAAKSTGEGATAIVLKNAPIQQLAEPSPTSLPTEVPTTIPTERAVATSTEIAEPTSVATSTATTAPSPTATVEKVRTPEATATTLVNSASGEPLVQINGTATGVQALVATNTPVVTAAKRSATATIAPESGVTKPVQSAADQPVVAAVLQPTPTVPPSATALPSATASPTATTVPATATATTAVTTYKVQAGDTPLAIAGRFDIGVDELFAANGLSAADARRLRVGQELIIPVLGQAGQPVATLTSTPTATAPTNGATPATAVAATATLAPTAPVAADSTLRLDAPPLRSPENGASLSCGGSNSLIWLPVSYMREGDRYLLHLGFLSGYNTDGSESVVWVLEQLQPANATIWTMDEGLCGLSPQNFGRQWRWYVEVVEPTDTTKTPVSLPSAIWGFSWN